MTAMGCRDFRNSIVDLARVEPVDAALRERVLAHTAECAACAALLAAEERLTADLGVLRMEDREVEAPQQIEDALLEAFRKSNPAELLASQRHGAERGPHKGAHWSWYAAAAAVAGLAVWLGVWPRFSSSSGSDPVALEAPGRVERDGVSTPEPADAASAANSGAAAASTPVDVAASGSPAGSGNSQRTNEEQEREEREQPVPLPASSRTATASARTMAEPEPLPAQPVATAAGPEVAAREIVTEFVPLTYAGWAHAAPPARLVRVRLSSAALLYFGLPAGGTGSVEADFVLGDDGLAHAVRFVRPAMASAVSP
jgi:hypothetical protein